MLKKNAFMRTAISTLVLSASVMGGAFSVSAETTVKVTYNAQEESVTAVVLTDRLEKNATITVEKDGRFWIIDEFARQDAENFKITCKLPTDCPSGSYKVEVTIGGETANGEIPHINKTMAAKAIEQINGATEKTFADVVEKNYSVLAIDYSKFSKYSDGLTELYYKYKPEGDLSIAEFSEHYERCYTLCSLSDLDYEECEKTVSENAKLIDFDFAAFSEKSEKEKEEIIQRFKTAEYSESTLKEQYEVWFCLAEINALTDGGVETYEKAIFETYADLLKLDKELYGESEDRTEVIRLMMENKYDTIKAIQEAFEDSIGEVEEKEDNKSSGGGSSSGRGGGLKGGTVGGISWTPTEKETENKTETQEKENFKDVSETHWCSEPIRIMQEKGIVSGMGNNEFCPDKNVTRAEFSKMLVSALFASAKADKTADFADEKEDSWCYEYVNKAYSLGIVSGSDGRFNPDSAITRQDMAVMLYRAQVKLGYKAGMGKSFIDDEKIADYAKEAVSSLAGMGVLNGYTDDRFAPEDILTRAQAVKALYEAMNILLK